MDRYILIKNLCFRYGEQRDWILKEINLQIDGGELVLISGISGVGKSTLLACINGIIPRIFTGELTGAILINGVQNSDLSMGQIALDIGSVLQEPDSQIFNLFVADELAFGCENLGISPTEIDQRVKRYSRLIELAEDARIDQLSGGEKARLVIGSVLMMQQGIYLLDEPFANLDRESSQKLLVYLQELTVRGEIVIIVEHRLDLVLPYITRMLWMDAGEIAADLNREEAQARYRRLFKNHEPALYIKRSPLFKLADFSCGYGDKTVLNKLTANLMAMENLVILGENGSGKTTLLKALAGLIRKFTGQIWRSSALEQNGVQQIGYVYQNPGYQLFMDTVYNEVDFQSNSPENTQYFIKLFGLESLQDVHPHSLSEGQKRLVTITAMAAIRPQVLLLDEPSVGLDSLSLDNLIRALAEIRRELETTIIMVTHDLRSAQCFAERVLILKDGRIAADGNTGLLTEYFNLDD